MCLLVCMATQDQLWITCHTSIRFLALVSGSIGRWRGLSLGLFRPRELLRQIQQEESGHTASLTLEAAVCQDSSLPLEYPAAPVETSSLYLKRQCRSSDRKGTGAWKLTIPIMIDGTIIRVELLVVSKSLTVLTIGFPCVQKPDRHFRVDRHPP